MGKAFGYKETNVSEKKQGASFFPSFPSGSHHLPGGSVVKNLLAVLETQETWV